MLQREQQQRQQQQPHVLQIDGAQTKHSDNVRWMAASAATKLPERKRPEITMKMNYKEWTLMSAAHIK